MKRIGLLTSGGDCQALNATMRGVVKGLTNNLDEVEIYGFIEGYKGMIYGNYRLLTSEDFSGILTRGGTIIGSSRQPFKLMRVPDENGLDKVAAMKQNYYKLRLDCVVILGGNGTQKTANLLREEGLNVIHLPKTIDNDIWGTDLTMISGEQTLHSDISPQSTSQPQRSTRSIRQLPPMDESLSLKLWDTRSAG